MKLSACLVGAVMMLLTVPQSTAAVTTAASKPKTKTVSLRSAIVPTWSDVAPYGVLTIKLARVNAYWNDLEDNDKDMFTDLVQTAADRKDAKADIKAFYDDATECLTVNSLTKGMTPKAFKTKMTEVAACLKESKIPTFEVLETAKATPAMSTYKPAKHIDTDDYDDGVDDTVTKLKTKTKTVTLRRAIVPSWDDLAPTGAATIKLARVQQYWDDLEANDLDLFDDYFKTKSEKKIAVTKIRDFYDEATTCLKANTLTKSYNERTTNGKLDAIHKCLKQTEAPTFVVASTVKTTGAKSTYNPEKHIDAADYPKTTAPAPTPKPVTAAPTAKYVTTDAPTTKPATTAAPTAVPTAKPAVTSSSPATSTPTNKPTAVDDDFPELTPAPAATTPSSGSNTPPPAEPISDVVDWPSTGGSDEPKTTEVRDFTKPPVTTELPGGNIDLPVSTPAPASSGSVFDTVDKPLPGNIDEPKTTEVRDFTKPPVTTELPGGNIDLPVSTPAPASTSFVFDAPTPMVTPEIFGSADIPAITSAPASTGNDEPKTLEFRDTTATPVHTPAPTQASVDVVAHLNPATAAAPIFRTLDANNDGVVSPQEMAAYTSRLSAKAHTAARKAGDKQGLALLQKIIDYHYKSLEDCATTCIARAPKSELTPVEYPVLAAVIEESCNVKFRYSLFAGTPPFEFVAGKARAVPAEQIASWFATQLQRAYIDLAKVSATSNASELLQEREGFVACLNGVLKPLQAKPVNHTTYYQLVKRSAACSSRG